MAYKLERVDSTEEMIMNVDWPTSDEPAKGWRSFRIEYINEQGFSNIEGTVFFPPNVDPYPILDTFCESINKEIEKV